MKSLPSSSVSRISPNCGTCLVGLLLMTAVRTRAKQVLRGRVLIIVVLLTFNQIFNEHAFIEDFSQSAAGSILNNPSARLSVKGTRTYISLIGYCPLSGPLSRLKHDPDWTYLKYFKNLSRPWTTIINQTNVDRGKLFKIFIVIYIHTDTRLASSLPGR